MSFTHIGSRAKAFTTTASSFALGYTWGNPLANDLVALLIQYNSAAVSVSSVTDTQGNTYTVVNGGAGTYLSIAYCLSVNGSGASDVATINFSGSTSAPTIYAVEWTPSAPCSFGAWTHNLYSGCFSFSAPYTSTTGSLGIFGSVGFGNANDISQSASGYVDDIGGGADLYDYGYNTFTHTGTSININGSACCGCAIQYVLFSAVTFTVPNTAPLDPIFYSMECSPPKNDSKLWLPPERKIVPPPPKPKRRSPRFPPDPPSPRV